MSPLSVHFPIWSSRFRSRGRSCATGGASSSSRLADGAEEGNAREVTTPGEQARFDDHPVGTESHEKLINDARSLPARSFPRRGGGWGEGEVPWMTGPLQAVIVDDEERARTELQRLLSRHPRLEVAGEAG